MDWKLNKKQIAEVTAIFTELCETITDKGISLSLSVRKNKTENDEVFFTYDAYGIYKDKIIYIQIVGYHSLMDPHVTSDEVEEIITLLKGDK